MWELLGSFSQTPILLLHITPNTDAHLEVRSSWVTPINMSYRKPLAIMNQIELKEVVNKQIRQAPQCAHEGKIVISRCCPSCKKIEHNNHSCNECTTSEDLEKELYIYEYNPRLVYFVKRVCKACKIRKIQNETSAAA